MKFIYSRGSLGKISKMTILRIYCLLRTRYIHIESNNNCLVICFTFGFGLPKGLFSQFSYQSPNIIGIQNSEQIHIAKHLQRTIMKFVGFASFSLQRNIASKQLHLLFSLRNVSHCEFVNNFGTVHRHAVKSIQFKTRLEFLNFSDNDKCKCVPIRSHFWMLLFYKLDTNFVRVWLALPYYNKTEISKSILADSRWICEENAIRHTRHIHSALSIWKLSAKTWR